MFHNSVHAFEFSTFIQVNMVMLHMLQLMSLNETLANHELKWALIT